MAKNHFRINTTTDKSSIVFSTKISKIIRYRKKIRHWTKYDTGIIRHRAHPFKNRQPGKEDVYSMGWVILWMMCESKELFYALRDNFIKTISQKWLAKFRNLPEIQLVLKMTDLLNPLPVDDVKTEWQKIMPNLQLITESKLLQLRVPAELLTPQYDHNR